MIKIRLRMGAAGSKDPWEWMNTHIGETNWKADLDDNWLRYQFYYKGDAMWAWLVWGLT